MILIWVMVPYLVGVAVLVLLSRLILKEAAQDRQAEPLAGGGLEFAPEKMARVAMLLFIGIFGLFGVAGLVISLIDRRNPALSVFFILFALLMARLLPGAITLTDSGLVQRYWLGKAKSIEWNDVRSVDVDRKQGRVRIQSKTGVRILHSRQLPDRARLLSELQTRCPDQMPAPGASVPPSPHPAAPPPSVAAPPADPRV